MNATEISNTTTSVSDASQWDADHVMTTYARFPVQFVRGEGVHLWDVQGKKYIDFLAGIAVCSVGHCHPYLTKALQDQAATLLHVSNLYLTEPQARLARRLVELSDFERVFFCNSGAEANEGAIKIARKYGKGIKENKTKIITNTNSFHGRTLAAVTATGQPKYSESFAPLPPNFVYVPFNDLGALEEAMGNDVCAVMLEPIQGEGGIIPATVAYLEKARELCDKHQALLVFDEVQTGMGRTGKLWAYQQYGVIPDVVTSAKGLGGGVPIGAILARGTAATTLVPGDHGSTFAGNPLATTAANAVLDILADENLLENARNVGAMMARELESIGKVRGMGLMIGVGLDKPIAKEVVKAALEKGLALNAPNERTLRIVPPLTLTESEARAGIAILKEAIAALDS
jgi:acetylornithine/N-succinyldiaminopimelate aminotransferase